MIPISLFTAGLAAGAALAAIPLIIHLVMRQTPKRVIFPALQLVRNRHKRSTKRLKVKNWLLLLARMALLALLALALARPLLYSKAARGDSEVPTALGLVFDTSYSMGYRERDRDRLAEAKDYAREILKKVHESSQVFVFDSAEAGSAPPPMSPATAQKRVDGLALHAVTFPLNAALGQAYKVVAASERPRREVYVLTDLARSAWEPGRGIENLKLAREARPEIDSYLMRLTPKDPRNVAILKAEARPAAGVATAGAAVEVRATVRSTGPATQRAVEFFLDGTAPENKRDQKAVDLPANGEVDVKFKTTKLPIGLHRAVLRLRGGSDPLDFDDSRYLTFRVRPPLKVLVVSDQSIDGIFIKSALDPSALPPDEPRPYLVEMLPTKGFTGRTTPLRDYACIFLQDVKALSDADWGRLNGYVREGGGLVVSLGNRTDPANFNADAASPLMPATLEAVKKPDTPTSFGDADFGHPLFSRSPRDIDADLSQVPVSRYYGVKPVEGSRTLLKYQDGAPALLERAFRGAKTGRVLLWTTPLARRVQPGPDAWNDFPQGRFWSFIEVMDQTVPYLAGVAGDRLNFDAGETVSLPIDPGRRFANYVVTGPGSARSDPLTPAANASSLEIDPPQALGQWSVVASGPEGSAANLGFSVNAPAGESELAPMDRKALDSMFEGKDRYQLAASLDELKKAEIETRIGRELFPWLMLLILALVTAENFLANKFHRERAA